MKDFYVFYSYVTTNSTGTTKKVTGRDYAKVGFTGTLVTAPFPKLRNGKAFLALRVDFDAASKFRWLNGIGQKRYAVLDEFKSYCDEYVDVVITT